MPKPGKSGLGKPVEVLIVGEIIKLQAKRNKFRERPGITIAHIKYDILNATGVVSI
jgi:hypothetical protein